MEEGKVVWQQYSQCVSSGDAWKGSKRGHDVTRRTNVFQPYECRDVGWSADRTRSVEPSGAKGGSSDVRSRVRSSDHGNVWYTVLISSCSSP